MYSRFYLAVFLLRSKDQGTLCPLTGERDKHIRRVMAYQDRNLWVKMSVGNSAKVGKPRLWNISGGSMWTTLRVKGSRETQSYGSCESFVRVSSRSSTRFSRKILLNILEKSTHASTEGGKNETTWKYTTSFPS